MGGGYVVAVRRWHVLTAVVAALGGRCGHVGFGQHVRRVCSGKRSLGYGGLAEKGGGGWSYWRRRRSQVGGRRWRL